MAQQGLVFVGLFLCKYINGLSLCFVVASNAGTLESRGLCGSWLGLAYNKRPFFWC